MAKSLYPKLQLLGSVVLMAANCLFFLRNLKIELAEATAILDINHVLITLGAFLFLGEKIGPRRILGIITSLIGALIIIGPSTDAFTKEVLLNLCISIFRIMPRLCFNLMVKKAKSGIRDWKRT